MTSKLTTGPEGAAGYPYLFSVQLSHRDATVSGRKWITEVGFRNGFKLAKKACELLHTLATDYRQALADGKGDQHAKAVFGQNAFAANEADALSNDGKRLRTFSYRGRDFVMEKHFKHGVKDSKAETLRIHFEWIPSEKMLLVGHCGKNSNF